MEIFKKPKAQPKVASLSFSLREADPNYDKAYEGDATVLVQQLIRGYRRLNLA